MKKIMRREFMKTAGIAAVGGFLAAGVGNLQAKEKHSPADKTREFNPGEKIEIPGLYRVMHDKIDGEHHAGNHLVFALAGGIFPRCKGCHEWVTFQLVDEAEFLDKNPQFES